MTAAWRERAACLGYPTSWWFPGPDPIHKANNERAKTLCAACPVRCQCLAYAQDYFERYRQPLFGIHGGVDAKEIGTTTGYAHAMDSDKLDQAPSGPPRKEIAHGTWQGYRQHIRYQVRLCDDCIAAGSEERAQVKATENEVTAKRKAGQRYRERQRTGLSIEEQKRLLDQERTSWIGL